MRSLNTSEMAAIAGGENHNVIVIDPVAMIDTISWMASTDAAGFMHAMKVTGMFVGGGAGAYGAATLASAYGYTTGVAVAAGVAGAFGGLVVGAIAFSATAQVCTSVYRMI